MDVKGQCIVVLNCVTGGLLGCAILSRLVRDGAVRGICPSLAQANRWRARVFGFLRGHNQMLDPETRVVHERLSNRKVQDISWCCVNIVAPMLLLRALVVLTALATGRHDPGDVMTHLMFSVLHMDVAVISYFPRSLTAKTMDMHYCLCMVAVAVLVCPLRGHVNAENLFLANVWAVAWNSLRRSNNTQRVPLLWVLNGLYAGVSSYAVAQIAPPRLAGFQVVGLLCHAGLVTYVDVGVIKMMHQGMQFEEIKELHHAAYSLLRSSCDVIVQVDSQGVIVNADRLSSFLLLTKHNETLVGTKLTDYFADAEDQEAFTRRLVEPTLEHTAMAETLHVSFKLAWGCKVHSELMWFRFKRFDGHHHFMVGIREFQDQGARPSSAALLPSAESDETDLDEAEAIVCVDSSEPGLPILDLSPVFYARVGRLPLDSELIHHVQRPAEFLVWLQESLNHMLHSDAEGLKVQNDQSTTLQLPHGKVHTKCRVIRQSTVKCTRLLFHQVKNATPHSEACHHIQMRVQRGTPPASEHSSLHEAFDLPGERKIVSI